MSFGYSLGDFIAGANLTWRLIDVLRGSKGADLEYQEAILELSSLQQTFFQVREMKPNPTLRQSTINGVAYIVLSAVKVIDDFLKKTRKLQAKLMGGGMARQASDSWQKMGWALFGKDELKALKDVLHLKLTHIGALLAASQFQTPVTNNLAVYQLRDSAEFSPVPSYSIHRRPVSSPVPPILSTPAPSQSQLPPTPDSFSTQSKSNFSNQSGQGEYFNGHHHWGSEHVARKPYDIQQMPMHPLPGSSNDSPQEAQWSPQNWDERNVKHEPDHAIEHKLLAIEKLMKSQKIAQRDNAIKESASTAARIAAEIKAAEQKALWEKRLDEEKVAAVDAENAKKAIEAEKKEAEEKIRAELKAALVKSEGDAKAAADKAKREYQDAIEAVQKEAMVVREALEKALAAKEDTRKPIKFKDAIGRKFSFPFRLCATWSGMEELIRQAFMQIDQFSQHVADGKYDLIGPNGEVILPQVWETVIEPEMSITMMMWPIPDFS